MKGFEDMAGLPETMWLPREFLTGQLFLPLEDAGDQISEIEGTNMQASVRALMDGLDRVERIMKRCEFENRILSLSQAQGVDAMTRTPQYGHRYEVEPSTSEDENDDTESDIYSDISVEPIRKSPRRISREGRSRGG